MDLEQVGAVLEDVLLAADRPRQLAGLADRDERGAQPVGDRRGEDEAAGLDAEHPVDRRRRRSGRRGRRRRSGRRRRRPAAGVMSLKITPGCREVGDVADRDRLSQVASAAIRRGYRRSIYAAPGSAGAARRQRRRVLRAGVRGSARPRRTAVRRRRGRAGGARPRRRPSASAGRRGRAQLVLGRRSRPTFERRPAPGCWPAARRSARCVGSRSFSTTRIGVATKIDE